MLRIDLDRDKLHLHGVSVDEVSAALEKLEVRQGSGTVQEWGWEKPVLIGGRRTPTDLGEILVACRDGQVCRLGILGDITHTYEKPECVVPVNGRNVVQVIVDKEVDANAISVS